MQANDLPDLTSNLSPTHQSQCSVYLYSFIKLDLIFIFPEIDQDYMSYYIVLYPYTQLPTVRIKPETDLS